MIPIPFEITFNSFARSKLSFVPEGVYLCYHLHVLKHILPGHGVHREIYYWFGSEILFVYFASCFPPSISLKKEAFPLTTIMGNGPYS
ncbi:hypothetical protein ABE28_003610 [Peribacillus muralis]|uniref:Uncharacterized protein n=1 Tax=Peribacillus muralis TaxID=264697 RepID=A0A1B3XJN7_9BACI|nr:hypothetical protein ABE28_003610 [Peribacillus muralis]